MLLPFQFRAGLGFSALAKMTFDSLAFGKGHWHDSH